MRLKYCALLTASLFPLLYAGQNPKASVWEKRGKRDLDRAYFSDAEKSLRKAEALDPESARIHRLLAQALIGQLVPNLRLFPDTDGILPKAEMEARMALELAPGDASIWCTLGIVETRVADNSRDPAQQVSSLNQAYQAFQHALKLDPKSFDAHYQLGKMVSDSAAQTLIAAAQSSPRAGKLGQLTDSALRNKLRARYGKLLDDALLHTREALKIDPHSEKAMRQMSGLFLDWVLLRDREENSQADLAASQDWSQKAQAARAMAVAAAPKTNPSPDGGLAAAAISDIVGSIASAAGEAPTTPGSSTIKTIVLLPDAAEKRLIKKVQPEYPAAAQQAGVQGYVVFGANIDKQGHVKALEVASGDPLLVEAARDAVIKWTYQPVDVAGEASEFWTRVAVRFVLPKQ